MHCRDDGDPGAELAQHLAEGAGVDRLSRHGGQSLRMPTVKSWPHRLTAVLSRDPVVVLDSEPLATEFDVEAPGLLM